MARGWHPAPARQFVIVVSGAIAVEVSDGETRRLDAGSMIFFEDVVGRDHLNRIVDDQEIMLAFLIVPEHWSPLPRCSLTVGFAIKGRWEGEDLPRKARLARHS